MHTVEIYTPESNYIRTKTHHLYNTHETAKELYRKLTLCFNFDYYMYILFQRQHDDESFNSYFHLDSTKNGLDDWFSRVCNSLYGFPLVKTLVEKQNICEDIIDDFCEYTVKPVFGEKVASELKSKMQVIKCEEPYIEIDTDNLKKSVWNKLAKYYRQHQLNLKTYFEELLLDMQSEYLN